MRLLFKKGNIHSYKNTKKGFLTVEAAIFLPVFIIGVLTLAYMIKFMAIQETIFHSFTDEARALSAEAGICPIAPFFESKLKDRIYDENGDNLSDLDLKNFKYLYHTHGLSGMISMDLDYKVNIKLPIPFYKTLPVCESLIFRGFIGTEVSPDPMPFQEMEQEKESELVWIFPRAGGKYHQENCIYIKSEPRELVMSAKILRKYKPCGICHSSELRNGDLAYCFLRSGEAYHTGSCPIVDKYVISIEKDEAIKRGYTPCSKCNGE